MGRCFWVYYFGDEYKGIELDDNVFLGRVFIVFLIGVLVFEVGLVICLVSGFFGYFEVILCV